MKITDGLKAGPAIGPCGGGDRRGPTEEGGPTTNIHYTGWPAIDDSETRHQATLPPPLAPAGPDRCRPAALQVLRPYPALCSPLLCSCRRRPAQLPCSLQGPPPYPFLIVIGNSYLILYLVS